MVLNLTCLLGTGSGQQSVFITIDRVELKNSSGEWVTVIRPDRRLDLTQEEPSVRFFNNGRIPSGNYSNVRVSFTAEEPARKAMTLERKEDYNPPVAIKKGTFVGVTFLFDRLGEAPLSAETIHETRLVVDQDEHIDGGGTIKVWS